MALPIHFMSVLPLPVWAIEVINRRRRGFIWKGEKEVNGGHCLLPWARVCMPMEHGGLDVLNLRHFGTALRCRWPWARWADEPRPWSLLLENTERDVANIYRAAYYILLRDGTMAKFWTDNWLPNGSSIASLAPALFSFVKDSGKSVAASLVNRAWIRDISGGVSVQAMAQYLRVWDITETLVLEVGRRDTAHWKLTSDGQFSVSSAYHLFFMATIRFACAKPIWKSKAPPRCKFFMWLAVHRRCLTADNLERRGWPSNGSCSLCISEPEDCTHLFVHCRYTQALWLRFRAWTNCNFPIPSPAYPSTEDWWLQARKFPPKHMRWNFDTVVILVHWCIWKERNARIFEQKASGIERVFDLIREDIQAWRAAGCIAIDCV